jgi:hypothetical protein
MNQPRTPVTCNISGELWKSDGTAGGTVMVKIFIKELRPVILKSLSINGTFFSINDGLNGTEL